MVDFSHLHYNIIQDVSEAILGKSECKLSKEFCVLFVVEYQIFSFLIATIHRTV